MAEENGRVWSSEVKELGDKIVALTVAKAVELGDYMEVVHKIKLRSNRFGFEPEITAKVARLGCRVYETPISYSGRSYEEGKKISWRDGFQALYCIVRYAWFD